MFYAQSTGTVISGRLHVKGFSSKRIASKAEPAKRLFAGTSVQFKPGYEFYRLGVTLSNDDDGDELMLNVLRCHLTY